MCVAKVSAFTNIFAKLIAEVTWFITVKMDPRTLWIYVCVCVYRRERESRGK